MNTTSIKKEYDKITTLLTEHRLLEALQRIQVNLKQLQSWELNSKHEEIQTAYQFMLDYMQQGVNDPERVAYYTNLIQKATELAKAVEREMLILSSQSYYFDCIRRFRAQKNVTYEEIKMQLESYTEELSLLSLQRNNSNYQTEVTTIRLEHEKTHRALFYQTWTSLQWSKSEAEQAKLIMSSLLISEEDKSLFLSSITMSLFFSFDLKKYFLLMDYITDANVDLSQRALIGFILITYHSEKIIQDKPQAISRISLLADIPNLSEKIDRIQWQFLLCRETKKIDQKMREEIIPTLMKSTDITKLKIGFSEKEEENLEEINPDWENKIDQEEITNKMKEMTDLQLEGADIYMSTFAHLKGYAFFKEMSNWFYPFDKNHSSVAGLYDSEKDGLLLDTLISSNHFCNSDNYSFCQTYMQLPSSQREMVSQQLKEQVNAIKEEKASSALVQPTRKEKEVSNQYIHDLYRFFKLFPRRNEFKDPFLQDLNFQKCKLLKSLSQSEKAQLTLANFFFEKKYFEEAISVFQEINEAAPARSSEIYQKIGFCYQKVGDYAKAIENYILADIHQPDHFWTIHHLALCYKKKGELDQAILYYQKATKLQPDHLPTIFQLANTLATNKQFAEALPLYFKWEYLSNSTSKAWRAIAWCSFAIDKMDESLKYYLKIIQNGEGNAQDFLNIGHLYNIQHDLKSAILNYKKSKEKCQSTNEFVQLFQQDITLLEKKGIHPIESALTIDLVIR
ncbi:MAG: tetratricopeptide repeat protein [Bacteroidaceae bacterium]|nr:tetratricopeptide repeat protein [Bacteroidaceae bacterium]